MANKDVAILDFGSSKITLLVGHRAVNNNFNIIASSEIEYAGFMDGEFIEEENLDQCITDAILNINHTLKSNISTIYVGVPGEFCEIQNKTINKNFSKKTKLTSQIVDSLFIDADQSVISSSHSVINVSPINFKLDDVNITYEPIGALCRSVSVNACFVLASNYFLDIINNILKLNKITNIEYVCSVLAEGGYLLDNDIKKHGAILVDVGYLTTSVAYVKGDGLLNLSAFSMGGAHISADISERLKVSFNMAEQLKQQLIVTLKPTNMDTYDAYRGNRVESVSALKVNEVALNVVDEILHNIKDRIESFEYLDDYEPIYLTGGGISFLKGIKCYAKEVLGRKIEIIAPKPLKFNKPDMSSAISLLDATLKMEEN